MVLGAFAEPDAPTETAAELAQELRSMTAWLGLSGTTVAPRGDLAEPLSVELGEGLVSPS
jgi:uncharacterized protein YcaQ